MAYLVVNRFFKAIHNKSLSSTFECPCVEATKLFFSITDAPSKKARAFVTCKPLQPSMIR